MAELTYRQGALTGNLIVIHIGDKPVGLIQSMQVQEDFGMQPVSGIGQVTVVEHVPSVARINISCETIYISTNSALQGANGAQSVIASQTPPGLLTKTAGEGRSLESIGIIPAQAEEILRGTVFNIGVYKLSNQDAWVRLFTDCSYSGGSISFQKHQIVVQNATFMALNYHSPVGASTSTSTFPS